MDTSRAFPSKSSAQTPLTLFSDVILRLSRLFQIDALTDWTLSNEQSLILHCVKLCYQRVYINNYHYTVYYNPVREDTLY